MFSFIVVYKMQSSDWEAFGHIHIYFRHFSWSSSSCFFFFFLLHLRRGNSSERGTTRGEAGPVQKRWRCLDAASLCVTNYDKTSRRRLLLWQVLGGDVTFRRVVSAFFFSVTFLLEISRAALGQENYYGGLYTFLLWTGISSV